MLDVNWLKIQLNREIDCLNDVIDKLFSFHGRKRLSVVAFIKQVIHISWVEEEFTHLLKNLQILHKCLLLINDVIVYFKNIINRPNANLLRSMCKLLQNDFWYFVKKGDHLFKFFIKLNSLDSWFKFEQVGKSLNILSPKIYKFC